MSKALFVGGQTFWDTFTAFRVCWLRGRYGGGKTALGAIMAARLLAEKRVNQVVSNIPMSFSVPAVAPLQSSAILLDESWIYIEGRRDVVDYAGFVRKFNHYLLLPSVFPIHNRLSFFFVQRVFNAYTIGLPMWIYEWGIRDKVVKERGYFGLWHPSAVFNHYPTNFVAGDDGGISEVLTETSKMAGFKGSRGQQQRRTAEVSFSNMDFSASENVDNEISESLDEFTSEMEFTLSDIERETAKIKRVLRR